MRDRLKNNPTINHYSRKLGGAHLDAEGKKKARVNRERVRQEQRSEAVAHEKKWALGGRVVKPAKNNNTTHPTPVAGQDKERLRLEADRAYEEWQTRVQGSATDKR